MEEAYNAHRLSKTVCKLCRQRKIRCNRTLPKCDSCAKAGVGCQYIKDKPRPGLRAGYVSSLEDRLNKLENEVQLLKANRCSHVIQPNGVLEPLHIITEELPLNSQASPNSISESETPIGLSHSPLSQRRSLSQFDPLVPSVLDELCTAWFDKYHSWFPIIHQPSLLEALQLSSDVRGTPYHLVLEAIVVFTIQHDYNSDTLSNESRRRISDKFRNQVLMEAISDLSLRPLQAILILAVHDLGSGRLKEYWNLVALAKRMAIQLGLRDLVANHCCNFNRVSTLPPRMLNIPNSLVEREEKIRAYWMSEVLDGASTVGVAWNVTISKPENTGLLPCSDAAWAFPEAVISAWPFDDLAMSSAYSLYVMLITNELYHVHHFLQQSYNLHSAGERARRRQDCQTVDEGLRAWRARFETMQLQVTTDIGGQYDSNSTLVECALDTATIALHQGLISPPQEGTPGTWDHAVRRCLEACESITTGLQAISDTDLCHISPLIIQGIFVASRFYLVHSQLFSVNRSPNFNILILKLRICASRWPYAARLLKVLMAATSSSDISSAMAAPPLPVQFWNLQYYYLDIDEALRIWAEDSNVLMQTSRLDYTSDT